MKLVARIDQILTKTVQRNLKQKKDGLWEQDLQNESPWLLKNVLEQKLKDGWTKIQ